MVRHCGLGCTKAGLLGVHLGHGLTHAVGKFALQLGLVDHFVFGVEMSRSCEKTFSARLQVVDKR